MPVVQDRIKAVQNPNATQINKGAMQVRRVQLALMGIGVPLAHLRGRSGEYETVVNNILVNVCGLKPYVQLASTWEAQLDTIEASPGSYDLQLSK